MGSIRIDSKVGLQLSAIVEMPNQDASNDMPLVILLHGTTGWKDEGHLVAQAKALANAGICSVRFDAPGSGDSGGTWQDDYRLTTYIDAVDDVYDYVVDHYDVNPERVGIWGHSAGGQVAAYVVSRHPDRFNAFCGSQVSPGKISSMFTDEGGSEDGSVRIQTEIFGEVTLPKAYFDDRAQYVTANAVKQISIPQLYIAGTNDTIVPASSVKETFDHANQPKEYFEFPTDHMYKNDPENLKAITDTTTAFFKKHLL